MLSVSQVSDLLTRLNINEGHVISPGDPIRDEVYQVISKLLDRIEGLEKDAIGGRGQK